MKFLLKLSMIRKLNMMIYRIFVLYCFLLFNTNVGFGQVKNITQNDNKANIKRSLKLLYKDDFALSTKKWLAEFEKPVGSSMVINNSCLDINSSKGGTVWFKTKLSGNIIITYKVLIVDKGGENDRVSDLNTFWMATNPKNPNIFKQDGKFPSYDHLHLYYAGVGGHDNTFTRFRKYQGDNGKKVLKEYTDPSHLLLGNNLYSVKIICNNGLIQYFLNDVLYWEFKDIKPYKEGYFGFRTTKSHQQIYSFKVFSI